MGRKLPTFINLTDIVCHAVSIMGGLLYDLRSKPMRRIQQKSTPRLTPITSAIAGNIWSSPIISKPPDKFIS
ncbi:hypothetical protein HNR39_002285 [Glaciimonas immobilis]|uniref:Uncharacterized protein n=1 Tax=Glaciimonas immobilis TaxID=728004 RepID=A0A840RVC8_9BURK|nr:hypothetical protein [Glaciimonas immobilis]